MKETKLEQARNRNSSFADLCAAFLADAEAKKVTPVRKVWSKKLDEVTAELDEVKAERDELRQKVAEYADAILKEYKGLGGRRHRVQLQDMVDEIRRHRHPRNQGDAAGEAAEALQARDENRAYRAEKNSK